MKTALIACTALGIALAVSCSGGEADSEKPNAGAVEKLIQNLGAEEFAIREAADIQLRKLGKPVLPMLRAAQAKANDAEIRNRLNALVDIWPPERKERDMGELINADPALVRELYAEWVAEYKRMAGFSAGYAKLKFLGMLESNHPVIAYELGRRLKFRPDEVLAEITALDREHRSDFLELSPGGYLPTVTEAGKISLSPARFLSIVFKPERRKTLSDEEITERQKRWKSLADTLRNNDPPTRKQWDEFRQALQHVKIQGQINSANGQELVSMVFNNASATDVWATIAIQANSRIFFDPPDLFFELKDKTLSCRIDNLPWEQALAETLREFGLSLRVKGGEMNRYVEVFREKK